MEQSDGDGMQRQVFLLLAVLALGTPLLSEVNHTLGQVMIFFNIVGLLALLLCIVVWRRGKWDFREKNNEEAGANPETIQQSQWFRESGVITAPLLFFDWIILAIKKERKVKGMQCYYVSVLC